MSISARSRFIPNERPETEKTLEFEIIRLKGVGESQRDITKWIGDINADIKGLFGNQKKHTLRLSHTPNKFIYSSDAVIVKGTLNDDPAVVSIEALVYHFGDKFKNNLRSWVELKPSVMEVNPLFKSKLEAGHFLNVRRFSFGCLIEMNKYAIHSEPTFGSSCDNVNRCHASFDHDKKQLQLNMFVNCYIGQQKYRYELRYSSIRGFILSRDENQWSVFIDLIWPPLLYKINTNRYSASDDDHLKEKKFEAKADDDVDVQPNVMTERVTKLPHMKSAAEVGRCHILKLAFAMDTEDYKNWNKLTNVLINVQKFADHNIPISFAGISRSSNVELGDVDNWYKSDVTQTLQQLPFSIRYAVHCVWTLNFKFIDEIDYHVQTKGQNYLDYFCRKLVRFATEDLKATEQALVDLFHAIDSGEHINILNTFEKRYKKRRDGRVRYQLVEQDDKKYCYIRRAIHAPSRTIFLPPMLYLKSRFLRSYDPEFAIRILIRDDNLSLVSWSVRAAPVQLNAFYQNYLVEKISKGIDIFGRHYDYLGNSTSQLRDNGFYMYARDNKEKVAADVRKEIGDLHVIKNPAKYVARLGQAFSQPMSVVPHIPRHMVICEPDIVRNGYTFSDGVGQISRELATELAKSLGIVNKEIPSAYQIRYAGYKGMLTLNPLLQGSKIICRQSMNKFQSASESLEVIKPSGPRWAYLNKPLINILNQKGISTAVFLRLQLDALKKVTESFSCSCKATLLLKTSSGGLPLSYDGLCHAGIDLLAEPFFRGVLDSVSRKIVAEIKENARIPLPKESCRTMLGVLDDTVSLEYGQVFIQYRHNESGLKKVITGEVLVTKFPCMHPGDVQRLQAVNIPGLQHIVDCIVFPQKGHRPHPDEMAGSDLDGDEYFVSWDKSLIFSEPNYPPMDYPPASANRDVPEVTVRHILEFYSLFVRDYGVGIIGSAHLALSDTQGIKHPDCISIAQKNAIVLDYAKTGEKVDLDQHEKTRKRPDFMEKLAFNPTYQSKRALGYLYRNIVLFEENLNSHNLLDCRFGNTGLLEVRGWEVYKQEAKEAYEEYKNSIGYIQRHFNIENEMGLVSESYMVQSKYLTGRSERNDSKDMVSGLVRLIFKTLRTRFDRFSKQHRLSDTECNKLASSWYMVTREKMQKSIKPLLGLPWTIADVLQKLAASRAVSTGAGTKHDCMLNNFERFTMPNESIQGSTVRSKVQRNEVHVLMNNWLESIKRKGYFSFSSGGARGNFAKVSLLVAMIANDVENMVCGDQRRVTNEEIVAITLQNVLDRVYTHFSYGNWKIEDDVIATLAISAAMTLFRFYRTRDINSICADDPVDLLNTSMVTICVDAAPEGLGSYARKPAFVQKLKRSGVKNVVVKVYEQGRGGCNNHALVSAIGNRQSLFKFKNALTSDNFYHDAINGPINFE